MISEPTYILPLEAFIRSVSVNSEIPHALFLGAGASISSNVLSAADCIWHWKREIFLSHHPGLEPEFQEISLGSVRGRIQSWLDKQGRYPPENATEEYGFYAESCYPLQAGRKAFFEKIIRNARPSAGYKLIGLLAENGIINTTWSTNFDNLTTRAAASFSVVNFEVGLDSIDRALRVPKKGELQSIALHGDYRYDQLRNTPDELRNLDASLRSILANRCKETPLIVIGYSGRDTSIMQSLIDAYRVGDGAPLYWCTYGNDPPSSQIIDLIEAARQSGRNAYIVPGVAFDDVMRRLSLAILKDEAREKAVALVSSIDSSVAARTPFVRPTGPFGTVIKSNAFKIKCPVDPFVFNYSKFPSGKVWAWIREKTKGRSDLVAVPFKGSILAMGDVSAIEKVFGDGKEGEAKRVPIDQRDFRFEDGAVTHLMLEALTSALASREGLERDGRLIWDPAEHEFKNHRGTQYRIHNGVLLTLKSIGTEKFVILKPTIKVRSSTNTDVSLDIEKAIKINIFGYQHNDKFNAKVEFWRKRLIKKDAIVKFPIDSEDGFLFEITQIPLVAGLRANKGDRIVPKDLTKHVTQTGLKLPEPLAVFGGRANERTSVDTHPIRGLVRNRPYDHSLTRSGLATEIRLGVVCPSPESSLASEALRKLKLPVTADSADRDYLMDFPGFDVAFGIPLVVPQVGDSEWGHPIDQNLDENSLRSVRGAIRSVITAIDELRARSNVNVITIVTPNRWAKYRHFESDTERVDLHDFVKAYCARHGIATQFIDESTLISEQPCRVAWWLSLALYVKSFRTPWVLQGQLGDTAFVGFGISIDKHGPQGKRVVLGCSHIFNEQGQGLMYRVSKIEQPIFDRRSRNAFLSRDDARRTGEAIRQLFYENRGVLPKRVVIHKRVEFRKDERDGLLEGLQGVQNIDLIEINVDDALRYVGSKLSGANLGIDNFPVARGSVVVISDYEALVWTHGSAPALTNSNWRYYQGKRRIPAPLLVRRHSGASDIETLAAEILGLTKMNWNTFDLYTKLPVTIETSSQIAKIGQLMEGYGERTYDYRLLM